MPTARAITRRAPADPREPLTPGDLQHRGTVSVPQAASLLGIPEQTAYGLARAGRLPVVRLGRLVRVQSAPLARMIGTSTAEAGQ